MASTPIDPAGEVWPVPSGPPEADPAPAPLALVDLEFSLATAGLDALEEVTQWLTRARLTEWFDRLTGTEEAVVLSTCHRVELLLLARTSAEVERWRDVLPGRRAGWHRREGRAAIRHLFRVAAGRESLAVGEGEVRHQVRAAGAAVSSRHPRSVLRRLLLAAAAGAETVDPSVPPSRSIAAIAAEQLLALTGPARPRVVVVGSGTVGRQVAEAVAPRADVAVVYHRRPPDDGFLRATHARAVPLDRMLAELENADAVVTAAKFGHRGLRAADLPSGHPLVLVDLGVPRNIDPDVRSRSGVRLIDLEELHALAPRPSNPEPGDARVDRLAEEFADRTVRRLEEPWVDTIRRAAENVRRSELAEARRFLGPLRPEQEVAVERLTRRLVDRLLRTPSERIRALPPGPGGDARRRFAARLLLPDPSGP